VIPTRCHPLLLTIIEVSRSRIVVAGHITVRREPRALAVRRRHKGLVDVN
jgi:hypothetical protein